MAYDSYPGMGIRTWHVVVFFGFVVLVADIVSLQMVGNTNSSNFVTTSKPAPAPVPQVPGMVSDGTKVVAIPWDNLYAGPKYFVPGCRPDVMASLRTGVELRVFDLLIEVLVVAVDPAASGSHVEMVWVALTDKQAAALELARSRGWTLTLKLRGTSKPPDEKAKYDLDEMIKFLDGTLHVCPIKILEEEPQPPVSTPAFDERPAIAPVPRPVNRDR
jgi:hypothetical protein